MSRAITHLNTIKAWAPTTEDPTDAELTRCLEAASREIERACGRRFATDTFTVWHSGVLAIRDDRYQIDGTALYLADPVDGLATLPMTAVSSVTEDGTALSVLKYDDAGPWTEGEGAFFTADGRALRCLVTSGVPAFKAWTKYTANVKVAYTAGYTVRGSDGTAGTMPDDIEQVACELTWLHYREGARNGLETLAAQGVDTRFIRLLSPSSREILKSYTLPRSPRTVA